MEQSPSNSSDKLSADVLDISTAGPRITKLLSEWQNQEEQHTKVRRLARENKKNVNVERQKGTILDDETIVPDHTINSNIKRETPAYVEYLVKPERLLIFTPPTNRPFDADFNLLASEHEKTFAISCRPLGWMNPWIQAIDSCLLHGTSWLEVVRDTSKPNRTAIEYIPREDLIIPIDTRDLQANEIVMRRYHLMPYEAEQWGRKLKWDSATLSTLLKPSEENRSSPVHIYKVFLKRNEAVYIAWWHEKEKDKWLKAPAPYTLGEMSFPPGFMPSPEAIQNALVSNVITPKFLTSYPIFDLNYQLTENEKILMTQGRASLDLATQQAITELVTSTINRYIRSSKLYISSENQPGAAPDMITVGKLRHGSIHPVKLDFYSPEPPPPNSLSAANALSTINAQQAGDTNFAALTRRDTEKTAHEIAAAQQEAQKMSSVQVVLYSQTIINVYALIYSITSSQSLINQCNVFPPEQYPLLTVPWVFSAAGDVEITARQAKLQSLQQFYPIFSQSPLKDEYLKYLIQEFFPDEASQWISKITSIAQLKDMISKLVAVLSGLPVQQMLQTNEINHSELNQLQSLIGTAQGLIQGTAPGVAQPTANPEPAGPPQ